MILAPNPVLGHKKCDFVIFGPKTINKRQGKQRFRAGGAKGAQKCKNHENE